MPPFATSNSASVIGVLKMSIQQDVARANLLVFLGEKPVIWGTIVSTSKSGMPRKIALYCVVDGRIERISYEVALVLDLKHENGCIHKKGCGMDMIFAITYDLGEALYKNGYAIKKETL